MSNPLAIASTWDLVAEGYTADLTPAFEHYARFILDRLELAAGDRLIDVACGPGTLIGLLPDGLEVLGVDFSPSMIAQLRAAHPQVNALVADGQALPLPDHGFTHAVSMFGVIFFPDRARGLGELFRVLRPGGRVALTSWPPLAPGSAVGTVFSALAPVFAEAAGGELAERSGPPLGEPADYAEELGAVGFVDVEVHEVEHAVAFDSAASLIDHFARSSAPLAFAIDTLVRRGRGWSDLRERAVAELENALGPGPVRLALHALVGFARKPA